MGITLQGEEVFAFFNSFKGRPANVHHFTDRLLLQKIAYLMNVVSKGSFRFGWYVRGPYSPIIADELFSKGGSEEKTDLDANSGRLLEFMKSSNIDSSPNNLELIASIVYMIRENRIDINDSDGMASNIHSLKPWFTEKEIKEKLAFIRKNRTIFGI